MEVGMETGNDVTEKPEDVLVRDIFLEYAKQDFMIYRSKEFAYITFEYPAGTSIIL